MCVATYRKSLRVSAIRVFELYTASNVSGLKYETDTTKFTIFLAGESSNYPHLCKGLLVVVLECRGVDIEVVREAEVGIVVSGCVVSLERWELLHLQDGC